MKNSLKIPIVCLQFLLVLGLLLGTHAAVKADQLEKGWAAYNAGNYQKALEIFKILAEQGDTAAQAYLGLMYHMGQGVTQDYTEAINWYRKAAERRDSVKWDNVRPK